MPFLNSLYGVKKVRHTKSIYFIVPFIQLQNKKKQICNDKIWINCAGLRAKAGCTSENGSDIDCLDNHCGFMDVHISQRAPNSTSRMHVAYFT